MVQVQIGVPSRDCKIAVKVQPDGPEELALDLKGEMWNSNWTGLKN